jgi:hypothetical protein
MDRFLKFKTFNLKFLSLVLWALILLTMCIACSPAVEGSDNARSCEMQQAAETTVRRGLPPIDLMVPDEIETATFALG